MNSKAFLRFLSYSSFGAISSFVNILTVPYMTRVLTPEEYGIIGLFISISAIFSPALSLFSLGLVSINKVNHNKESYQLYINQYITLVIINSVISLAALLIGSAVFNLESNTFFLYGLIFYSLSQSIIKVHYAELVQDKKYMMYGLYTVFTSLLLLSLTFIFLSMLNFSWEGRVLSLILTDSIVSILRVKIDFSTLKNFRLMFSKSFLKETFIYGLPLSFMIAASWGFNESDRLIITYFFGLENVGIYTAAYSLGMASNVLNNAMTNTISPTVYNYMKEGRGRIYIKKVNIYYSVFILLFSILASIVFYNFGEYILGESFKGGVLITSVVLIAFGFNGMYRSVGLPIDYMKMNKLKSKIFILSFFVNLSLSVILIFPYGILGPAIATFISFLLMYALTYYFSNKVIEKLKP